MKHIAAYVLLMVGLGGGGYIAGKTLIRVATSFLEWDDDISDALPRLSADGNGKYRSFRIFCLGLCPEMERRSW
jgi:hypothetical protein